MARIAISYRRSDSQDITGRIFDRLAQQYGKSTVFRDIDSIQPGIDFRTQIAAALGEADALLVVLGPRWLGRSEGITGRIDNEADPVRIEVETALKRDIPIIPILVGGMKMPEPAELPEGIRDLAFRHAVTVDGGRDFDHHVEGLIRALDKLFSSNSARALGDERALATPARRSMLRRYGLVGGLAAIAIVAATAAVIVFRGSLNAPPATQQPPASQSAGGDGKFRMTPTFDCVAGDYPDERTICNNNELMVLDQTLRALYIGVRNRLSPDKQKILADDERAWVEKRHACNTDVACIRAAYQTRIKILLSWQ